VVVVVVESDVNKESDSEKIGTDMEELKRSLNQVMGLETRVKRGKLNFARVSP
jgi:hypothetical protein